MLSVSVNITQCRSWLNIWPWMSPLKGGWYHLAQLLVHACSVVCCIVMPQQIRLPCIFLNSVSIKGKTCLQDCYVSKHAQQKIVSTINQSLSEAARSFFNCMFFNSINLVLICLYNCHKYEYFNIASQNGSDCISSLAITHYNVHYIVLITTFC